MRLRECVCMCACVSIHLHMCVRVAFMADRIREVVTLWVSYYSYEEEKREPKSLFVGL